MRVWLRRLGEQLSTGFVAIPAACALAAVALGLVLTELDQLFADDLPFIFGGGPAGARSLLSALVTSMVSLTGVVFSITIVVLQLASSQFSPRVLRSFLRSRSTQVTLGVFIATFLYAVIVLRAVRGDDGVDAFVPQLAVTGAFLLLLASAGMFIHYIRHITQSIRVSTIVRRVGDEARELIARTADDRRRFPVPSPPLTGEPSARVAATEPGVVVAIDVDTLVERAREAGNVLEMRIRLGDFAPEGAVVLDVHPASTAPRSGDGGAVAALPALLRALPQAQERTMEQDIAFGFRQLADIAERALSPGVNDPTTAVQALDEIHDLLRRLVTEPDAPEAYTDEDGVVRLVLRQRAFGDYLDLGVDEILDYGQGSSQVRRRMAAVLDDLLSVARPEHRPAILAKQVRLVRLLGTGEEDREAQPAP
ncbi:DUF2254 domain-containing protein [Blastococcus montanus]|uniref:DUF2254 domain-containing protein n=1 Tax=Blastococcus montanus TaxID=3144973 RepID=UPI0032098F65